MPRGLGYGQLPVYSGLTTACDNCGETLKPGDVVTVADGGGLVFCYSDEDGMCLQEYLFLKMKGSRPLMGKPMVFKKHSPAMMMPIPRMPTMGTLPEHPSLWQRILRFFSGS